MMAAVLTVVGGIVVFGMFRLAAAGRPLHHEFATKAAVVDGEMIDVVSNMPLVRAFCRLGHEHRRFDRAVHHEMRARSHSLLYLERVRILHALVTVVLTIGLLAWAITLWQRGEITTGDVVLACTLGLSVLHATRDLAVALVDVIQHLARLSEALATLLIPHDLRDHPEAAPLVRHGARVEFDNVSFQHPGGRKVFENFDLRLEAGQRVGLVGPLRRRQVDAVCAAAALLRRAGRPHPDRRPGHRARDAGEPARRDRGGAAGRLDVPSLDHGEYPLRPAGRLRRGGAGGGGGGAVRLRRASADRAWRRSSATGA